MSKTQIVGVKGRRVWDSGRPTVEVDVTLECGATGRAIACRCFAAVRKLLIFAMEKRRLAVWT